MHFRTYDRNISPRSTVPRPIALTLAFCATGTSAWISIVAGFERGGTTAERAAWAAVALVVLLAAHLLPALTRGEPMQIKLPALMLWVVCLVGTGYGHATFFSRPSNTPAHNAQAPSRLQDRMRRRKPSRAGRVKSSPVTRHALRNCSPTHAPKAARPAAHSCARDGKRSRPN